MDHLLLTGNWKDCVELIDAFTSAGYLISLPPAKRPLQLKFDLMVARLTDLRELETFDRSNTPWVAWCSNQDPNLMDAAYQAGALAVFPETVSIATLLSGVQRILDRLSIKASSGAEEAIERRYQRGDVILLETGIVLEVKQGVIAQTMVHQDGAEVLLGLCGPGQLLVPHPADTCYIQLMAHTDAVVTIQPWTQASIGQDFSVKIRSRLQQMEAWAAMQSRPYIDQRLLGIFSLLAEQFGTDCNQGRLIDIRITHTQLAAATGATRTTITRTLGNLRRQGQLTTVQTKDGERYCLIQWIPGHHDIHCGQDCAI